ncbi:MAG: GNAT family acetyltransferase [Roseibium sp.]|uniref:GNAT family acetyltransferase n=1 Tax=Roseibium sp. TaxID=1936156 RepID=UPI002631DDE3|nr:GNAT family acetyltransferase [Roseibium sp.]MCV0428835.1 GNAT family acetyltransferase [Roseibium sp.]
MESADDYSIVSFEAWHRPHVIELWEKCGMTRPWNDPDKDIDRKLTDPRGGFFVLLKGTAVIGSVMAGYDGHRGAIYYLAIDPAFQSVGLGQRLMNHCEAYLLELGCPKINLFVRQGNEAVMKFYEKLGFSQELAVPLGKRLIPDN